MCVTHFEGLAHPSRTLTCSPLRGGGRRTWAVVAWHILLLWFYNLGGRGQASWLSLDPRARPQLIYKPMTCGHIAHTKNKLNTVMAKRGLIMYHLPLEICFIVSVPRESVSSIRVRPLRSSAGCWWTSATAFRGTMSSSAARVKLLQRRNVNSTAHSRK